MKIYASCLHRSIEIDFAQPLDEYFWLLVLFHICGFHVNSFVFTGWVLSTKLCAFDWLPSVPRVGVYRQTPGHTSYLSFFLHISHMCNMWQIWGVPLGKFFRHFKTHLRHSGTFHLWLWLLSNSSWDSNPKNGSFCHCKSHTWLRIWEMCSCAYIVHILCIYRVSQKKWV